MYKYLLLEGQGIFLCKDVKLINIPFQDPVGTFIGRKTMTEGEIEEHLRWKDKSEVAK